MKFQRKKWRIEVKEQGDGLYSINTNTYEISDVTAEDFKYAVLPFIDLESNLEIIADDHLQPVLVQMFRESIKARKYIFPSHWDLTNYWFNIGNKREKYSRIALKNFLKGQRILYVGAGPSLNGQWQVLKKIKEQNKAFVVAGGSGIRKCMKHNFNPHLCIALDPYDPEKKIFQDLPDAWQKNNILLASARLHPYCYGNWQGKLIHSEGTNVSDISLRLEGIEREDVSNEGKTGVTTWILNLAMEFGAHEVYMIGTDLTTKNKNHSERREKKFKNEASALREQVRSLPLQLYNCSFGRHLAGFTEFELKNMLTLESQDYAFKPRNITSKKRQQTREKLIQVADDLIYFWNKTETPAFNESTIKQQLLQPIINMLLFRAYRTDRFETSLLKDAMITNASIINYVLNGGKYKSHLFSAWDPVLSRK